MLLLLCNLVYPFGCSALHNANSDVDEESSSDTVRDVEESNPSEESIFSNDPTRMKDLEGNEAVRGACHEIIKLDLDLIEGRQ